MAVRNMLKAQLGCSWRPAASGSQHHWLEHFWSKSLLAEAINMKLPYFLISLISGTSIQGGLGAASTEQEALGVFWEFPASCGDHPHLVQLGLQGTPLL